MAESTVKAKAVATTSLSYVGTVSFQHYDPVAEKLKELEKRIDAWQNKFEFVDVRKK